MVPTVVERSGGLNLARGPRIISLVLEAFNCMSLLSVHLSKLMKKYTYQSQIILVEGLQTRWNHQRTCMRPHQCDNVQNEGQIKLACGCMLPVVAGALSPNGQNILKDWQLQMTPCCKGQVNDIVTMVLRDTGSTTCVVKSW